MQHNNESKNNSTLESRLENYIKDKFPIAYIISKSAPIYLLGGAIRDLILAKKPKDLDFIVLGNEYSNSILEIFQKYNINFSYNRFGGYKINYHDTQIDLWTNNDLYSAIQYNVDGLFFYLKDNINKLHNSITLELTLLMIYFMILYTFIRIDNINYIYYLTMPILLCFLYQF